ncbi:glycosyltransferase [bacterium]|nr:glycosyltransferase [bacterium]
MDISILISTYHRPDLLAQTLESFCELDIGDLTWEILVVDNAGERSTQDVIGNFSRKIPVKYLVETSLGKTNALNYILSLAKGDLFVFTDDDIIASKNWLKEIWEGTKRWPEHFIFGGRILPRWPHNRKINHSFYKEAYAITEWEDLEGVYSAYKVWGPNMAIKREVFKQGLKFNRFIGPSCKDNIVDIVGDETELLLRLEKSGYKTIYLPNAIVFHQIRPEQMEKRWIYKRAFRVGRSMAYFDDSVNVVKLFGIPRYLIRQFLHIGIKRILSFLTKDGFKGIDAEINYWKLKGKIYQYKIGIKQS